MKKIEEKNREIAIMMGFKEHKLERNWFWGKKRMTYYYGKLNFFNTRVYIQFFKYNSDWNWLMNVVSAIENTGKYIININGTYCEIININDPNETFVSNENSKLDSVFDCVYKFACNYNENERNKI